MDANESPATKTRTWVAWAFTLVEDIVYVGLGLLLAASLCALLVSGAVSFAGSLMEGSPQGNSIALLDRILLMLLMVELLYAVQVSFRMHRVQFNTSAPTPDVRFTRRRHRSAVRGACAWNGWHKPCGSKRRRLFARVPAPANPMS